MATTIEERLNALGFTLPQTAAPLANYVPTLQSGNQLYVSGQLPIKDGTVAIVGQVGSTLTVDQGVEAAQLCAINILAQAKSSLGSLERITQCVKLGGFINSPHTFTNHAKIMNGASDLIVEALEDKGRHARFAVGASSLPLDAAVEVEALFTFE